MLFSIHFLFLFFFYTISTDGQGILRSTVLTFWLLIMTLNTQCDHTDQSPVLNRGWLHTPLSRTVPTRNLDLFLRKHVHCLSDTHEEMRTMVNESQAYHIKLSATIKTNGGPNRTEQWFSSSYTLIRLSQEISGYLRNGCLLCVAARTKSGTRKILSMVNGTVCVVNNYNKPYF